VSSQTSFDTTFTWNFPFLISVNYSGSWSLVYWGENGTATQSSVTGHLSGSENHQITITLFGVGYIERTLCADATKLNPQSNLNLTLTIVRQSRSTSASNPSARVCATAAA
jgi:hypothetical protein